MPDVFYGNVRDFSKVAFFVKTNVYVWRLMSKASAYQHENMMAEFYYITFQLNCGCVFTLSKIKLIPVCVILKFSVVDC